MIGSRSIYQSSARYEAFNRPTQRRFNVELTYDGAAGLLSANDVNTNGVIFELSEFGGSGPGHISAIKAGDILTTTNVIVTGILANQPTTSDKVMVLEVSCDKIRANQKPAIVRNVNKADTNNLRDSMAPRLTTDIFDQVIHRQLIKINNDATTLNLVFGNEWKEASSGSPTETGFVIENHGAENDVLRLGINFKNYERINSLSAYTPTVSAFRLNFDFIVTTPYYP
jgi:hypothetical protein